MRLLQLVLTIVADMLSKTLPTKTMKLVYWLSQPYSTPLHNQQSTDQLTDIQSSMDKVVQQMTTLDQSNELQQRLDTNI